jgi:hypothetical protein
MPANDDSLPFSYLFMTTGSLVFFLGCLERRLIFAKKVYFRSRTQVWNDKIYEKNAKEAKEARDRLSKLLGITATKN